MRHVDLTSIANLIMKILQAHIGREYAIKRPDLLAELRKSDDFISDRQMRKSIEKVIPWVCSCAGGYFLPMTDAEVGKAVRYLDKKIYGLYDRRRAILKAHPKVGPRQLELRG
jgi:hypothetical protein